MKEFTNWILIPGLMLLPVWYHSLKDPPRLPPGVRVADGAKTAGRAVAAEEAAVARGAAARAISGRALMTGAGLAGMAAVLLWPEISDALKKQHASQTGDTRKAERDAFERQARAAEDVTAEDEEEPRERARAMRRAAKPQYRQDCRRGGCPHRGY